MIGEREVQGTSEEGVGEILARERIARGLTLEDVAQQLKFGPRMEAGARQARAPGVRPGRAGAA
jgi:transcriptional regulator with XRE-family HTH domain